MSSMPSYQSPLPQVPVSNPGGTSKKGMPWIAIVILVIILIIGGGYLLLGKSITPAIKKQPPLTVTSQAPAAPAAPAQVQENLENDLNAVNIEDNSDSDFASIDQDLKQL